MSDNEQLKQIDLFGFTPVLTYERFAVLSGLSPDSVRGMADRGQLPTRKIGKRRMVNLVLLLQECSE